MAELGALAPWLKATRIGAMSKFYKVTWEIDLEANNPEHAAKIAARWLAEGSGDGGWYLTVTDENKISTDFDTSTMDWEDCNG
jgi:hypothetical protein